MKDILKRLTLFWVVLLITLSVCTGAGDAVEPATLSFTNFRSEATAFASATIYPEGDTLMLTNIVLYAGTDTNSELQGLSNVVITVNVGRVSTNVAYTGTSEIDTDLGSFWCSINVPSDTVGDISNIQIKITDENTNSYTYMGWKKIHTAESLSE